MNDSNLIAIGGSWGGMRAVTTILSSLPSTFPAPIVVAQHRHVDSTGDSMKDFIAARSALPVREAEDKDAIEAGHVYLAPADYHLMIDPGSLSLSTDERVQFSRPSIDVLFESAAESYGHKAVGVLLTGANADGARGLTSLKHAGAMTIVQDPASAERPEMPQAAIRMGAATFVLPLEEIAPRLLGPVSGGQHRDGKSRER